VQSYGDRDVPASTTHPKKHGRNPSRLLQRSEVVQRRPTQNITQTIAWVYLMSRKSSGWASKNRAKRGRDKKIQALRRTDRGDRYLSSPPGEVMMWVLEVRTEGSSLEEERGRESRNQTSIKSLAITHLKKNIQKAAHVRDAFAGGGGNWNVKIYDRKPRKGLQGRRQAALRKVAEWGKANEAHSRNCRKGQTGAGFSP